jgi:hypothetical protein
MSAGRLSIARRPPLDLPLAAKTGSAPPSGEAELELGAALDVPAFLRRQEG